MTYITTYRKYKPRQLSWEDVFFEKANLNQLISDPDTTATITRKYDVVPQEILNKINVPAMQKAFELFNEKHKNLFEADRNSLYTHFKIPKTTGGFRQIDAPCEELQTALRELKSIFTDLCGVLYHTSAYAYIEHRSTVNCVQKHANFKSKWFLKTDISGFFPSTTREFAAKMLSMVFPISEIMKTDEGRLAVKKATSLGFLNGGLPQGTCLSPFLSNAVFIPIDHALMNKMSNRKLLITRYADDIHISGVEHFPYKEIIKEMEETFQEFGAPYVIKPEKTHYGNIAGNNWMLGLMLNKYENITVGKLKKKYFKASLDAFIKDTAISHNPWSLEDVMEFRGLLSYYEMVEKQYFKSRIALAEKKYRINFDSLLKSYFMA